MSRCLHSVPWLSHVIRLYHNSFPTDLLRSQIYVMSEIDIANLKTPNFTKLVQVRNFIHLFEFKCFSTCGEGDTIFLCWLLLHRQLSTQPTCGAHSAQSRLASPSSESQPSSSEVETQLTAFFWNLSPRFRCMTSPKYSGLNSYLGFLFWHLLMTHPLRTRVNTCVNVASN